MKLIPVMAKLNFQQLLLQSSGSHDPFTAEETFLIISVENRSKDQHFYEMEIFCNFIMNASLLKQKE